MKILLKILIGIVALVILLFVAIQLVPVQRDNPPVVTQVKWDSAQTESLFKRACADCHSNETQWPWYAKVAPVSWLIARDVNEGRSKFNLSTLSSKGRADRMASEIQEQIESKEMPLPIYLPMHPEARLTPEEAQALITGMKATLAQSK